MAADDSTPSGPDDELLEGLRDLAGRVDPEPEQVRAGALAALSWRTIDAELAMITSDSGPGDEPSSDGNGDRLVTFQGAGLTVQLRVGSDRVLRGRLVPGGTAEVEVCWKGGSTRVLADATGGFRAAVPSGPLSLRCQSPGGGAGVVTTDWIVL